MIEGIEDKDISYGTNHKSIGIVALLPDTLDGPWMGRHQICNRLAKNFNVIWVNPPNDWRKFWLNSKSDQIDLTTKFTLHESNLISFNSGKWLPKVYKPKFISQIIEYIRLKLILHRLKSLGCNKFVLYLTRPGLLPDIGLKYFDLICYHIFDDYSFSETKTEISASEKFVLETCDIPFFSSTIMLDERGSYNPNSINIPNGVDLKSFSRHYPIPDDLSNIPRPIIGYSGVIKKQLNLDLLLQLAKLRNEWSFVFVGPIMNISGNEKIVEQLMQLKNTFFLGSKDITQLPGYIKQFDVGLLCYKKNNYTKYITPLKLHEYMAGDINIVGSNIPPLEPYKDLIYLAESTDQWVDSIELALSDSVENTKMRKDSHDILQKYDWDNIVLKIEDTIVKNIS